MLEDAVRTILHDEGAPKEEDATAWTCYVAESVARLCSERDGLRAYCAQNGRGEYMLDQVWAHEEGNAWSDYRGLAFAMECEWGGSVDANWEDFIKLADVRADAKLFIGNLWPKHFDQRAQLLAEWDNFWNRHRHVQPGEAVVVFLCEKGPQARVDSTTLIRRTH